MDIKLITDMEPSNKADIKAWTVLDSTEFGFPKGHPGYYPEGICVNVYTKNHTYEAVIPLSEIKRAFGLIGRVGCSTCETCGPSCAYCTYEDGIPCECRLGCQ